jgi:nucleoside-diphosphate-sugar epimerase
MRVALLGATGHVGRVLTVGLGAADDIELILLARAPQRAQAFASAHNLRAPWQVRELAESASVDADAFVNCLGAGDPGRLPGDLLELESQFDSLFLRSLRGNDGARGIAMSSGVVYDSDFQRPTDEETPIRSASASATTSGEAYALAKARAEATHRAAGDLAIVDVRLFGLYSRFVDRSARYLMNDVVDAIAGGCALSVSGDDIVRDFVAPADLTALVGCILDAAPANTTMDVYSAAPVRKSEMLADFSVRYGLTYTTDDGAASSPTGTKPNYYSTSHRASAVGYRPSRTSLESLSEEIDVLLDLHPGGGS